MSTRRLIMPTLPDFSLDDNEIEWAINTPVEREIVKDIAIKPDGHRMNPKASNRIIAYGISVWESSSGIPTASLIKTLLLQYFLGQLNAQSAPRERRVIQMDDRGDDEQYEEGTLHLDDVDTSDDLGGEGYRFGR